MITAMTELLGILALALLAAARLATLRDLHDDGYGRRPPPPDHHRDPFDPSQRFRTC